MEVMSNNFLKVAILTRSMKGAVTGSFYGHPVGSLPSAKRQKNEMVEQIAVSTNKNYR